MNITSFIPGIRRTSGICLKHTKRLMSVLWRVLMFNILEGVVIPKKYLSVSLEKGSISVAFGSKFLARPRIKGFKRYLFDEDEYVKPDAMASATAQAIGEFNAGNAEIILVVSREWVIMRLAELPVVVKDDLPRLLRMKWTG